MAAPDVNVLVAASRSDHRHHRTALNWLNQAIADCAVGGAIELLPIVVTGFLRVTTNMKIFLTPAPIGDAVAFVDALLAVPGVEIPEVGREWPTLRQFCNDQGFVANDIPDAWIAAAVRTLGSRLVTFDRGFARLLGRNELTLLDPASRI
jgi:toxin-antitoxin system PIN domain toxin